MQSLFLCYSFNYEVRKNPEPSSTAPVNFVTVHRRTAALKPSNRQGVLNHMGTMIKILLLFSLAVSASQAAAQSPYYNSGIYADQFLIDLLPVQENLIRAREFDAQKMYAEAIAEVTKAISAQPDQAFLYYARGSEYCNQALESGAPEKSAAEGGGARKLYKMAIEDYTRAIALEPEKALYYFSRANGTVLLGDDAQAALADYSTAIKLDPGNPIFYAARAGVYAAAHQYVKAFADYDKAIALKADGAEYHAGRGSLYAKTGEYLKALTDYNQAIPLDPDNAQYYAERGLLYKFTEGCSDKALDDFNRAILLRPGEALLYSYRGACYRSEHKLAQARDDLSVSCERGITSDCESLADVKRDIARGDRWIFFGSTAQNNQYYDSVSMDRKNENGVTVWTRSEHRRVQDGKIPPGYTVTYSIYNCAVKEKADLQAVQYSESGVVLSTQKYSLMEPKRIVPGSIEETLMQIVCRGNDAPGEKTKKRKKEKP